MPNDENQPKSSIYKIASPKEIQSVDDKSIYLADLNKYSNTHINDIGFKDISSVRKRKYKYKKKKIINFFFRSNMDKKHFYKNRSASSIVSSSPLSFQINKKRDNSSINDNLKIIHDTKNLKALKDFSSLAKLVPGVTNEKNNTGYVNNKNTSHIIDKANGVVDKTQDTIIHVQNSLIRLSENDNRNYENETVDPRKIIVTEYHAANKIIDVTLGKRKEISIKSINTDFNFSKSLIKDADQKNNVELDKNKGSKSNFSISKIINNHKIINPINHSKSKTAYNYSHTVSKLRITNTSTGDSITSTISDSIDPRTINKNKNNTNDKKGINNQIREEKLKFMISTLTGGQNETDNMSSGIGGLVGSIAKIRFNGMLNNLLKNMGSAILKFIAPAVLPILCVLLIVLLPILIVSGFNSSAATVTDNEDTSVDKTSSLYALNYANSLYYDHVSDLTIYMADTDNIVNYNSRNSNTQDVIWVYLMKISSDLSEDVESLIINTSDESNMFNDAFQSLYYYDIETFEKVYEVVDEEGIIHEENKTCYKVTVTELSFNQWYELNKSILTKDQIDLYESIMELLEPDI